MRSALALGASAVLAATVSLDAQQAGRRGGPAWRDIQGFNIVLVVGENQSSGASSDSLPGGARKALSDMREFLPYRHYRVLDSQWTSCCSSESVRVGVPISGKLQGVAGGSGSGGSTPLLPRAYFFSLALTESSEAGRLGVKFALRLDEPSSRSGRGGSVVVRDIKVADLRAEIETLGVQIAMLRRRVEVGTAHPDELKLLELRHSQLQRQLSMTVPEHSGYGSSSRSIMDSSFTMDVGETVVVGTSRLGGDKALIALVTAVRRSTSAR